MDPTRLKALLESVQAVREAVSVLEREITAALADRRAEAAPFNATTTTSG